MCKDVSGDVLLIGIFSAVFKDWRSVEFGLSAAVFFFFLFGLVLLNLLLSLLSNC